MSFSFWEIKVFKLRAWLQLVLNHGRMEPEDCMCAGRRQAQLRGAGGPASCWGCP